MSVRYSIVIPAYNEELVVDESYKRLKAVMDTTNEEYELIFVNDGSRDKTPELLRAICKKDKKVKMIDFSRNFGHQTAITAGMDNSSGQAIVVIDADLQDPPEVILEMIAKWKDGYDVVYAQRSKRKGETFFKLLTAKTFYRLLSSMTTVDIPVDTGDFRLIDRKVCDVMNSLTEKSRYVRGLVSWVGFKQTAVHYVREERFAGETKYPLKKMLKFAMDGITAFSSKPLKIASTVGTTLCVACGIYWVVAILMALIGKIYAPSGLTYLSVSLFVNGIMLLLMGVAGEYIGRIYDEAKNRPLYIIKERVGFEDEGK